MVAATCRPRGRRLLDFLGAADPNGRVTVERLAADQDYFLTHGYQQQRVDMSVLVDHQYVDYAAQVLGRYP